MGFEYFVAGTETRALIEALRRDGAVAVTNVIEPTLVDAIVGELRPELDTVGLEMRSAFNGGKTLRIAEGILTTAPSTAALVEHDLVVDIANEVLLPHCSTYSIGSMSAIEILPGESAQVLHRDDSGYPIETAGMELLIGVMWALTDFTADNGGTRVVPGSHRFIRSWHLPDVSNWESAVMPKGSVLFYLGSTWHGGGANHTDSSRIGLVNTYSLGWLRPENNQFLDSPPDVAAAFSPRLRALLGYAPHGCGDDKIGNYRGECAAWVDPPPEPAWREERGQVGTATDAEAQDGV
ncbi:MAG: phytanoyl-CoA dioxygenase family protein [Gammaproteobacteria bacterium]|nr:phytanoyl-CoA dioxygenase family protein [Gammaproteobacteria bacterium]